MKARILKISHMSSEPIPISEDRYKMFMKKSILENSTVTAWISDNRSAQNDFIEDVWNVIQETLRFKTVCKFLTDDIYDAEFARPYSEDIYLVPLSELPKRKKLFMPFFSQWYEIYVRKEGREETSNFYIQNFPVFVWIRILMMLAILSAIFWMVKHIARKFSLNKKPSSISDCFFYVLFLAINQVSFAANAKLHMRILTLVIAVFGFLIMVWYSAFLTASQAISLVDHTISSLEELKDSGTHRVCVRQNSFAQDLFRIDPYDDKTDFLPDWKDLINGPSCPNDTSNLRAICDAKVASVMLFRHFTNSDGVRFGDCVVVPFKDKYFEQRALVVAGSRFPHKKLIQREFSKMQYAGLIQYLWLKNRIHKPPVEKNVLDIPEVKFGHVEGVLFLYGIFSCLSVSILLVEIVFYKISLYGGLCRCRKPNMNLVPNELPYVN